MNPLHVTFYTDLAARLTAAHAGDCGAIVAQAAEQMRCSVQTTYRRLQEVGWTSGRKTRTDRGELSVPFELAKQVGGLITETTRKNGKRIMGIEQARTILESNFEGVIDPETGEITMPSASTLSRAMRAYGCHPDQLDEGPASVEMRSLHPNHVWQADASVCVLFYLPSGKLDVMDETKFYKNKPDNITRIEKERVIRWVITEHYSGAIYFHYSLGSEDALGMINTLIAASGARPGEAMHGLPFILTTDKGAGNTGGLAKHFFKRTGIRHITHAKGNPRAKGQVEQANNLIETHFECRLRMMGDVVDLASLNAAATQWRRVWNATAKHSRHGHTRDSMWLTIKPEHLRIPASAEVLRDLVGTPPKEIKVPSSMIVSHPIKGYGTCEYNVRFIPGVIIGQTVAVSVNPYRMPAIDLIITDREGVEHVYTIEPIKRIDGPRFRADAPVWGENYQSMPHTAADEALTDIKKAAYGTDTLEAAQRAEDRNQRIYANLDGMADVKAALPTLPTPMPRQGTVFDGETVSRKLPPLDHVEAAQRLRAMMAQAGLAWDADCMRTLQADYPGSVPVEEIEDIAATMIAARQSLPAEVTASPLRLVAGGRS